MIEGDPNPPLCSDPAAVFGALPFGPIRVRRRGEGAGRRTRIPAGIHSVGNWVSDRHWIISVDRSVDRFIATIDMLL